MGTAVMVTSGKGGTGKTSLTAGVASCLAALGRRVLCVDLDIGLRNLDLTLGMSDRALMDFTDVMEYRCPLLSAAVEQPEIRGLFLLTAPQSSDGLDRKRFRALIEEACDYFDLVFMDSPAGLGEGFQLAMAAADRVIVVSAVDPAALRDAQRTVAELHELTQLHLVMNRVQPKLISKLRTSIDSAMDTAGLPLLGVVPEDPNVTMATAAGVPLILTTYKGAAPAYLNIAKRLLGQRVPLLRIR
ncbi:MAG: septum site-determining protein MinD [Oscillospiraceae bacterium]|jgi:septum site-determining protein MinD|nr:septum site-determining protein MinD [Oscillospiraceae bacterium]MCI8807788.1 septum site-determining protein MinD [Oscillospiraceae bacterium]MCI9309390.1 septum site-determining protein MinD [Oscillospiraceae bacterium]MCI9549367.1 septum site-determining protein MinD [Oscillospiraceae bacterium]